MPVILKRTVVRIALQPRLSSCEGPERRGGGPSSSWRSVVVYGRAFRPDETKTGRRAGKNLAPEIAPFSCEEGDGSGSRSLSLRTARFGLVRGCVGSGEPLVVWRGGMNRRCRPRFADGIACFGFGKFLPDRVEAGVGNQRGGNADAFGRLVVFQQGGHDAGQSQRAAVERVGQLRLFAGVAVA